MTAEGKRRGPKYYRALAEQEAAERELSVEEYSVYKGSSGSAVTPVNSAGGLLVISIVLTVIAPFVLVLIGVLIAQSMGLVPIKEGGTELTPVMWFFIAIFFIFPRGRGCITPKRGEHRSYASLGGCRATFSALVTPPKR